MKNSILIGFIALFFANLFAVFLFVYLKDSFEIAIILPIASMLFLAKLICKFIEIKFIKQWA
ncbi:hypothetical protein [Campylobacter concisus]|jgi:hypothetical protein